VSRARSASPPTPTALPTRAPSRRTIKPTIKIAASTPNLRTLPRNVLQIHLLAKRKKTLHQVRPPTAVVAYPVGPSRDTLSPVQDPYAAIARFYDRAVAQDEDIPLYEALAGRFGDPVLEIGAGTGRVAVPLAVAGHAVVALDPSPAMIAVGKARVREAGADLCWVEGSIETCPLEGPFGLIFCAIDGFLHLTTAAAQRDALRQIRRLLRPDGCLVLDLPTLAAWSDWQPGVRPLELLWNERDGRGVTTAHFTTFRAEPSTQRRHVTHIFEEIQPDGVSRRWLADYDLRFIGRYELELLLRGAGLRVTGLHGDYELGPFLPDSERMIVLAQRGPSEEG